jgi:hypothetical protein
MSGNFEEAIQLYCTTKKFQLEEDDGLPALQQGFIIPSITSRMCGGL